MLAAPSSFVQVAEALPLSHHFPNVVWEFAARLRLRIYQRPASATPGNSQGIGAPDANKAARKAEKKAAKKKEAAKKAAEAAVIQAEKELGVVTGSQACGPENFHELRHYLGQYCGEALGLLSGGSGGRGSACGDGKVGQGFDESSDDDLGSESGGHPPVHTRMKETKPKADVKCKVEEGEEEGGAEV
ncbi:hypothetical protein ACEPPN_010877 [Leptodophora sp. 'Broadleaf-Isolate-01']